MSKIYVALDPAMTDEEIVAALQEAGRAQAAGGAKKQDEPVDPGDKLPEEEVAKRRIREMARLKKVVAGKVSPRRQAISKIAVFQPEIEITETEPDKNLVFGWASVAVKKDGTQLSDLQGHSIDIGDLEDAAYNFTINYRKTGEMHSPESLGEMVESFVVTPEKLDQMGLARDALPLGWWVGFKVPPEVFAKVKGGAYRMFSIQGKATLEPID